MVKNLQIESLRGIIIMMIVFYHYCYRFVELYGGTKEIAVMQNWGHIGVGFFFLLSGFFLIPNNIKNFRLLSYYKKKIIRLYPAYLICVSITFIFVLLFGLPNRETSFLEYMLNIFMLNGYLGFRYVDGSYWYLTYLIPAIIVTGFSIKTGLYKKSWFYFEWLVIGFASAYSRIIKIEPINLFSELHILTGGEYTAYIIIGIMVKNVISNEGNKLVNFIIIFFAYFDLLILKDIWIILPVFTLMIILILAAKEKLSFLNFNILQKNGELSYIVYLLHQNIGYCILLKMSTYFNAYYQYFIFFPLAIVIIFSSAVNKYLVEKIQKILERIDFKNIIFGGIK